MLKRCLVAIVLAFALTSPQMVRPQELPTIHIASVTNDTCSAILYAMKLGLLRSSASCQHAAVSFASPGRKSVK